MPIHLESHPEAIDLTPGTTKSYILVFLYRNAAYGYRPTELSDTLDIPDGTATTTLSRLYADGLVGKTADGHYHALKERDDVQQYVASHAQLERLFGHHREHEPTANAPLAVADDELATELDALDAGGDGKVFGRDGRLGDGSDGRSRRPTGDRAIARISPVQCDRLYGHVYRDGRRQICTSGA